MELKYDVFPNFYKRYDWTGIEEDNSDYFTGRTSYLQNFWNDLCNLMNKGKFSRHNRAFIGPRKLGKTTYLHRCYNVAFWEQDEVIPLYYCFPQREELNLRDIAEEIAFQFLRQTVAFITKDQKVLKIEDHEFLLMYLEKKKYEWFDELAFYWKKYQRTKTEIQANLVLEKSWHFVQVFAGIFSKKALLIIDEYQKTAYDLFDQGTMIPSQESIAKVINNHKILTLISGSQISMLAYDVITPQIHNRIPKETFHPLREKEAHELTLKYAGEKGYNGIEKDVYNMVGGNPHYIKLLFTPTSGYGEKYNQQKKWSSLKEIKRTYDFEMLNRKGTVFHFWEEHLNEKYELLNGDPPEHKGLTLKLLQYIAEKQDVVYLDELRTKFPEVEDMRQKMRQLRKADLIQDSEWSEEIYNFSDRVLPAVVTKMHQKLLLGSSSKKSMNQYLEKLLAIQFSNTKKDIEKNKASIDELQKSNIQSKNKQDQMDQEVKDTRKTVKKLRVM